MVGEVFDVNVFVTGEVEVLDGAGIDQRLGELELVLGVLRVDEFVLKRFGLLDLTVETQDGQREQSIEGSQKHRLLLAGDHPLDDRDQPPVLHALPQERVGLLSDGAVRDEVVRPALIVDGIDLALGDEAVDAEGLVADGSQLAELVRVDLDVLTLAVLIAGNDVLGGELAVDRTDLLVLDRAVALAVQLVEANLRAARRRRVGLDRNGHQTELQETLPARSRGHGLI